MKDRYTGSKETKHLNKLPLLAKFALIVTPLLLCAKLQAQNASASGESSNLNDGKCPAGTPENVIASVTARGLRERSGPGTEFPYSGFLQTNDQVIIECQLTNETGEKWDLVRTNSGEEAYVSDRYLRVDDLGILSPTENITSTANTADNPSASSNVINTGPCQPGSNGQLATVVGDSNNPELPIGQQVSVIDFSSNEDIVQTPQCHSFNIARNLLSGGNPPLPVSSPATTEGYWGGWSNPDYNQPILGSCNYANYDITSMVYHDYLTNTVINITDPYGVISWFSNQRAADNWLGYWKPGDPPGTHRGFAVDWDIQPISDFTFTLAWNKVNGKWVQNDTTAMKIMRSPSTGTEYLFAFVSLSTPYARANGQNEGEHNCSGNMQFDGNLYQAVQSSGILR